MIPLKDDNPSKTFPFVTLGLIILNTSVFFYEVSLGPQMQEFISQLGATPYELTNFKEIYPHALIPLPFTLFSAMFIHGGFMHLLGNMLYLWIFGNNIEDFLGHFRFLLFYLVSGLLASIVYIITDPNSILPLVGASGAIAGVLGAYFLIYPRAKILTLIFFFYFIRLVRIPAVVILSLWFLIQVLNSQNEAGIAWYAHIGGFIAGVILIKFFKKR